MSTSTTCVIQPAPSPPAAHNNSTATIYLFTSDKSSENLTGATGNLLTFDLIGCLPVAIFCSIFLSRAEVYLRRIMAKLVTGQQPS